MKTLLFLLLLTAGCGSPKVWYQPGKSGADAYRDLGACRMEASRPIIAPPQMNGLGAAMYGGIAYGNFTEACMLSKGYQLVPANTVTNGSSYPKK